MAEEAANVIGEFDEGFSNRQTWHNAALAAIAVWFEDEELLTRAVQGPTGMLAHLVAGLRRRRHVVRGRELPPLRAARPADGDGLGAAGGRGPARGRAPGRAAGRGAPGARRSPRCPITPSRRGRTRASASRWRSRCTSSSGRWASRGWATTDSDLWSWLRELYARAGARGRARSTPTCTRPASRAPPGRAPAPDLSWWALLEMAPVAARRRAAVDARLRAARGPGARRSCATATRYASLECGRLGGGHGHPDRLQLTLHADGQHWLADPGTGSYVTPRSVLVSLDPGARRARGSTAAPSRPATRGARRSTCSDGWSWARGRYGELPRTLVAGDYLLDVVELSGAEERTLELPWHPDGRVEVVTPGGWVRRPARRPVRGAGGALHRHHGERRRSSASQAERRRGAEPPPPFRRRAAPRERPGRPGAAGARAVLPGANARGRAARVVAVAREHARRARASAVCRVVGRGDRGRDARRAPTATRPRRRAGRSTGQAQRCGSAGSAAPRPS